MKSKAERMEGLQKVCTLCMDEMSIKSNLFYSIKEDMIHGFYDDSYNRTDSVATHALVFMLRGLVGNWKQPLCYYYVGASCNPAIVHKILEDIIPKILNTGFNLCSVASDMGANFTSTFLTRLLVTPERPYFLIGEKKIYVFWDFPHLIKCLRNNLMTSSFSINNNEDPLKRTDWNDILEMSKIDNQTNFVMAPKITPTHLNPNTFQKMRVKYATQLISHTVSCTLKCLSENGKLQNPLRVETLYTILEKFDKLFDMFNSSSKFASKSFLCAYENNEEQNRFLTEMFEFIDQMKCFSVNGVNNTKRLKFLTGMKINIRALPLLFLDLQRDYTDVHFQYILTRRLNSDALENFFALIRGANGYSPNPTTVQFAQSFKKMLFLSDPKILKEGSPFANCEFDNDELLGLNEIRMCVNEANEIINAEGEPNNLNIPAILKTKLNTHEFVDVDVTAENALVYVTGYIIFKAKTHFPNELEIEEILDDDKIYQFTHLKKYSEQSRLIKPPTVFIVFTKEMDNVFCANLPGLWTQKNIRLTIFTKIMEIQGPQQISIEVKQYIVNLFIRLRIFQLVKLFNRNQKFSSLRKITNLLHV